MKLTQISVIRLLIVIFMIGLVTVSFGATLRVGVGVTGAPIVEKVASENGPYYFGFCIDLMNKICARLNQKCVYKQVTFSDQFDMLDDGDIDLLVLSSPYTRADLKQYAMTIPYAVSKIKFVTLHGSPINDLADINDKKIGVMKSTFYNLLIQSPFNSRNQIIAYKSDSDLFTDLAQKKIDIIVLNNVVAYRLKTNNLYNFKLIGEDIPVGEGYGIIALPSKAPLIDEISKTLLDLQKDGTYVSIYQKYYKPE